MNEEPRSENKVVRAHIWVKGRVQGVGFRAHVEYHARRVGGLTGWVRNVGDDRV
jgi:acylphosphatase